MDPMFRDMDLRGTKPVVTEFLFPAIRIYSELVQPSKRDRTLYLSTDFFDNDLDLLDRLAQAITGSPIYYHKTRKRPKHIQIGKQCRWSHEANLPFGIEPLDMALVRHRSDPFSYLILGNGPYGLRVILNGKWINESKEFEYLYHRFQELAEPW